MRRRASSVVLISLCLLVSCAPFQDSPFSDQILHSERDLNAKAIGQLAQIEADGRIRIAIFTDAHQNYMALDRVIAQINQEPAVDFVVNLGDFTNSAYNMEYDQFLISYLQLQRPTVSVIGNHDAIGAGPSLFRKIFGPLNSWFESSSARFILFNSANLESPKDFNIDWLLEAVRSSVKPVFIFTHIPLIDAERFTGGVATTMYEIINHPNTKAIFNGHNHVYGFQVIGGTIMAQAARVESNKWLMIEITGNQFELRERNGGGAESQTLKP